MHGLVLTVFLSFFHRVSSSQLQCISSTKLPFLFSTLELFVGWIKEGLYDFSSVPMALKAQFKKADLAELEKNHMSYPGPSVDLLTELNELVEALLHAEPYIVKKMNEISQVSRILFLIVVLQY